MRILCLLALLLVVSTPSASQAQDCDGSGGIVVQPTPLKSSLHAGRPGSDGVVPLKNRTVIIVCHPAEDRVWGVVARNDSPTSLEKLKSRALGNETVITLPEVLNPADELYLFQETTPGQATPVCALVKTGENYSAVDLPIGGALSGASLAVAGRVEELPREDARELR